MAKNELQQTKNLDIFIDDLKMNEERFKLRLTTFTKRLYTQLFGDFKSSEKNNNIKKGELYFIAKVRRHVETLEKYPVVTETDFDYIRNYLRPNTKYVRECNEIDLSAAYWTLTYRDGSLSTELYNEGLKLSKTIRLVALGALATRVMEMEFDGKKYGNLTKEPLLPHASVFFRATQLTWQLMNEAREICGKETFFIWSDAIFFRGKNNLIELKDFFKHKGINISHFKVDSITYKNSVATVMSKDYASQKGWEKEKRTFNFKKLDF